MSKSHRYMPSQRGLLSEEDEELWTSVAQNLQPVRRKERVSGGLEPAKTREATQPGVKRGRYGPVHQVHLPVKPPPAAPPPVRSCPPTATYDWRHARKLASGRAKIEARLDLHGLRRSEAYGALRAFILACHAKGLRNVLVITGKGGGPDDDATGRADLWERHDRGILKRSVPRWLAEPEMRTFVVGYATAHPRHGGEGALYLQLRRCGRLKDRG